MRIQADFEGKLFFVVVNRNTPEVVINADAIHSRTLFNDSQHIIEEAALLLQNDIVKFANSTAELKWPIDLDELNSEARQIPQSIVSFLSCLLKSKDHPNRSTVNRLIESYSSDLIFGVTRGKFVTAKHFLLGLGLHNLTGQKKPIEVLSHLGHCIDYNLICEIETAQAKKSQLMATASQTLPLSPSGRNESVLTYFWVDNFDVNIETQTGHGAINTTRLIAFQEESPLAIPTQMKLEFPRTNKRKLSQTEQESLDVMDDPKKEPPLIDDHPDHDEETQLQSVLSIIPRYVL